MSKHIESPEGGENAVPRPRAKAHVGGTHGPATPERSPRGGQKPGPRYRCEDTTPDLKGNLFGHKHNERGC